MENLVDIYNKNQELVNELLSGSNIDITLKLDGVSLQVLYNDETGKYEYHQHIKEFGIGPIVTRLKRYFCKELNDAIEYFNSNIDKLDNYKFINTILYKGQIILLSAMYKDSTDVVDDYSNLLAISQDLGIELFTCLWQGKLSDNQISNIINLINFNSINSSEEFRDYVFNLFTNTDIIGNFYTPSKPFPYELFDTLKVIPGIIFNFRLNGKVAQYQISDKYYDQIKKSKLAQRKLNATINKTNLENIISTMVDYLEKNVEHFSDLHMENLEKNFIKMMSNKKMYNKLFNLSATTPLYQDRLYKLQISLLSPELQSLINKKGTIMKTLYENYLIMFYHSKPKDTIIISKEFVDRMNKIIEQL